ncbi:MAG: zf-HC2 domain-containing protein [Planctomycetes bacterium]|nr:zf-HC2 domain-containing protein [Planctomycetota bacterium]
MKTTCDDARALVPSYLDGELPEPQSAPLRTHLLACPACREVAKEGKVLRRWFEAEPARVSVPAGFAARVARRAFAGDPGLLVPEPPAVRPRRPLLPFLLLATAAAAALLFVLAVAIQRESLPHSNRLDAQEGQGRPPWLEAPAEVEPNARDTGSGPEQR